MLAYRIVTIFAILSQFVILFAMTGSLELLTQTLKQHGFSTTKSRLTVFQALENCEPMVMRQLVRTVAPSVNRASVYRIIELFEQLGIVQRLQIGWKYKLELSNDFQEHHHHLTCIQCGNLIPFHEPSELHEVLTDIANTNDFQMQRHQIELQGLCKSCIVKTE